jgi:hypothetical protein
MRTKTIIAILIGFITFNLSSCKKEENEETKSEVLTKQKWTFQKIESYNLETNELLDTDEIGSLYFNFTQDHKLYIEGDKNSQKDPEILEWDFNYEKNMLFFIDPNENEIRAYHINKLENDEMILKENLINTINKVQRYSLLYFNR